MKASGIAFCGLPIISMVFVIDIRLPGGPWGPWQFASGVVVKAFRLNSYNNNVNNNVNNNNNGVNFNALNTANALNSVSLTGLGSLYGGNVLRPSVIYRCVQEFTFELLDLQKSQIVRSKASQI